MFLINIPTAFFLKLLGFKDNDESKNSMQSYSNYSIKIDKKSMSKWVLSRLKNNYNALFNKAFIDLKDQLNDVNVGLYVFVYGSIDENNDTILNVKKHHITFRYDEVRKTVNEL